MGNRASITKRGSLSNIRHSLSDIARPYDKIRNNDKNTTEKKKSSLRGGKHEKKIKTDLYPNAGGENHNELKRSVPWAKTTNCSQREEATAVTERTVDYE